jgi:hypothetical protein
MAAWARVLRGIAGSGSVVWIPYCSMISNFMAWRQEEINFVIILINCHTNGKADRY